MYRKNSPPLASPTQPVTNVRFTPGVSASHASAAASVLTT